ncbi:hypothetical protein HDV01_007455 [Terramyces sp. JEL0728]|nr:hypothetical protein HDV01_007455 [Terramyces sp. JEL0728]
MELEDYYSSLKNLDLYEDYFEILALKLIEFLPKLSEYTLSIEKKINHNILVFKKQKTDFVKEMIVFGKFISLLFKTTKVPNSFLQILNDGIKRFVNEQNISELEINLLQYGLLLEPFTLEKENAFLKRAQDILKQKQKNIIAIKKETTKKQQEELVEYYISDNIQQILDLLKECDYNTGQTILDMARIYTTIEMISFNDMYHLYKYCCLNGFLDQANLFIKKQKEILEIDYKSTILIQDKIIEKYESYKPIAIEKVLSNLMGLVLNDYILLKIKEQKDYYLIKQELKKIHQMGLVIGKNQCKSWGLLLEAIDSLDKMDVALFSKLIGGEVSALG